MTIQKKSPKLENLALPEFMDLTEVP